MQPLSYLQTTGGIIWTAACVLIGFLLTWAAFYIINKIPAAWLCDYNETPSEELLSGKRVNYKSAGIILSFVSAACLVFCRLQFNKGFDIYFIVLSLIIMLALMIAVCDIKYTIIPDQFTVAIGVLGLIISVYDLVRGFGILHTAWWSPIAGAALGAGTMMFIDFIGMIIYKKDGMGFGDVKLFAAIGIVTGFPGTLYAFALSLVTASLCFAVIIIAFHIKGRGSDEDENSEDKAENIQDEKPDRVTDEKADEPAEETDEVSDNEEAEEDVEEEMYDKGGQYLAFGPYIAISVICYIVFYDFIHHIVNLYIGLF